MRRGYLDLLFALAAAAVLGWLFYSRTSQPAVAPAPDSVQFTLNEVSGGPLHLADVPGPVLITLTSLGCPPCLQRVNGVDRQAVTLATQRGLTVWNIIVYASPPAAAAWVAEQAPSAHKILVDENGARVGVEMLGGSDTMCYILLDKDHRKVWQGPANLLELEAALDRLGGVSGAAPAGTPSAVVDVYLEPVPSAATSPAVGGESGAEVTGATAPTPHLDPPPGPPQGEAPSIPNSPGNPW